MTFLSLDDFERDAVPTLLEYAAIPCLSPDYDTQWRENGHLDDAIALLAKWAGERELGDASIEVRRLEGRTPLLVITVEATAPTTDTVVLYGHMDKQPPLGEWSEGLAPFTPVRRGNRIYARGVADDGYATFSALLAIEAMVRAGIPHSRLVVLIEASEESGSPDLVAYLDELGDHLGAVDLMICLDSGALTYDRLWVTTSLRGVVNIALTVQVLEQGQHSGVASGVVPSSFRLLRQLIDRVEDAATGAVLVEALHADIPEDHVRAAHATADEFGDVAVNELPVVAGLVPMGTSAAERILQRTWAATMSVTGMGGIPEPQIAGNVLRPFTTAVLSFRLPPNVNAQRATQALLETLTSNPPANARVSATSDHYADGWVAPPLAPWLRRALDEASRDAFGRDAAFTGEGGTIPFLAQLGQRFPAVQFVATGVLGPHSNAHGIDEMLDLDCCVAVTNAMITVLREHATK